MDRPDAPHADPDPARAAARPRVSTRIRPGVRRWAVLAAVLALALAVRLPLAPHPGFEPDVAINKGWATSGARLGLARSYVEQVGDTMLPNYPPLGLAAFVAVGHVEERLPPADARGAWPSFQVLIKLPAIAFDLATAVLLALVVGRLASPRAGLAAALLHALHPAVLYDSAVWGQVDSIFTFFSLASLSALALGRGALAPPLLALAVLAKPQGLILGPLVVFALLRRPRELFLGSLLAVLVLAAGLAPFARDPAIRAAVLRVYTGSVDFYPTLTCSAFNLWWALYGEAARTKPDHELLLGLASYRTVGLALFLGAYAAVLASLRAALWPPAGPRAAAAAFAPLLAGGLVVCAFHLLATQMHERYLYAFVVLALPLAVVDRRGAWLYAGLSLGFLANLVWARPFGALDRALYGEFPELETLVSVALLALFTLLWRRVRRLVAVPAPSAVLLPGPAARAAALAGDAR